MAFDLNSIGSLISGGGLNAISKRTKVGQEDVAKVLSAGIPALVGGMRRNAGADAGAASLSKALADHSGADLSNSESVKALKESLIPLASVVTPNIPEAEVLSGMKISTRDDMIEAAKKINAECGCSVLIKGGHNGSDCDDVLLHEGEVLIFEMEKIDNPNTHGTGCTLSSAIACNLAKGMAVPEAVKRAKEYITGAIKAGLDLGHGRGPLDHGYDITTEFKNT